MATFTVSDLNFINRVQHERGKLSTYNFLLRKYPQIFSHLIIEIHPMRDIPWNFLNMRDDCFVTHIKPTKMFCESMTCNLFYPRGNVCKPQDTVRTFKSGNSTITACQPACYVFNTNWKDTDETPRGPLVRWSDTCHSCVMMDPNIFRWMVDDYNRAEKHVTIHTDTVGTGFDYRPNQVLLDANKNETFKFAINQYFCDDFALHLSKGECTTTWWEDFLGFFFGDTIVHLISYGIQSLSYGGLESVKHPNVGKPKPPDPIYTMDNWLRNINHSAHYINPMLVLSDLHILDNNRHVFWTNEYSRPYGNLVDFGVRPPDITINADMPPISKSTNTHIPPTLNISPPKCTPYNFEYNQYGQRVVPEETMWKFSAPELPAGYVLPRDPEEDHWYNHLPEMVQEFVTYYCIDAAVSKVLNKKTFQYLVKDLIPKVTKMLLKNTTKLSMRIFQKVIVQRLAAVAAKQIIRMVSKAALKLAKLAIALSNPIEWILAAVLLADFILSFLDVLHENDTLLNQSTVDNMCLSSIENMRVCFGYGTMEFGFIAAYIYYMANNPDKTDENGGAQKSPPDNEFAFQTPDVIGYHRELVSDSPEDMLIDLKTQIKFMSSLTVNSDGQYLPPSPEVDLTVDAVDAIETVYTDDFLNFQIYNQEIIERIENIEFGVFWGLVTFSVFFCIIAFFRLSVSFLLFVCMCIVVYMTMVQMCVFLPTEFQAIVSSFTKKIRDNYAHFTQII